MYQAAFGVDDHDQTLAMVRSAGIGHLVTVDEFGALQSTALPFVVDDAMTTLRAHFARANPHWREVHGCAALMIVPGSVAYISPNWYPSKAEHHRVVPTSNYELVHIRGSLTVRDDAEWKLQLVHDLTDHHEHRVDHSEGVFPWSVDDAPRDFIDRQLGAIVGVEIAISSVEHKRKMSQNRSAADRVGAAEGLRRSSDGADSTVADMMDPDPR